MEYRWINQKLEKGKFDTYLWIGKREKIQGNFRVVSLMATSWSTPKLITKQSICELCWSQLGFKIVKSFLQVSCLVHKKEKAGVMYLVIGEFFVSWHLPKRDRGPESWETVIESTQNWLDSHFLYGNYWWLSVTVLNGGFIMFCLIFWVHLIIFFNWWLNKSIDLQNW